MLRGRRPRTSRSGTVVLDDTGPVDRIDGASDEVRASLVMIHAPGATDIGRRVELDGVVRVGRDADCGLSVPRGAISRAHAELSFDDGTGCWQVRDLGSTNGTFVNEREVKEASLRDGDQVRFGDAVFKFLSDASSEVVYHDELYQLSVLDGLTGIHNRRFFTDFLERELASAQRHDHPLTLVMFDIDHFKRINDQHGHPAGDAVLRALAERIKPRIRREDLLARYGGEELGAILTMTGLDGGVRFAEAIRVLVSGQPFDLGSVTLAVTLSAGVATTLEEPTLTAAELIKRADELLYEAKRAGRNCVVSRGPTDGDW